MQLHVFSFSTHLSSKYHPVVVADAADFTHWRCKWNKDYKIWNWNVNFSVNSKNESLLVTKIFVVNFEK